MIVYDITVSFFLRMAQPIPILYTLCKNILGKKIIPILKCPPINPA
jgi:hypothetical protein